MCSYLDKREISPSQDLLFKYIMDIEYEDHKRLEFYENGEMTTNGIAFYSYLDTVFQLARTTPGSYATEGATRDIITYEQEGYIAPEPGTVRSSFEKGLPSGYASSYAHSFGKSIVPLTSEFLTSLKVQTFRFLPAIRASSHYNRICHSRYTINSSCAYTCEYSFNHDTNSDCGLSTGL